MKYQLVILGSGESGVGAALLAQYKGISVFVSDGGAIKENYKKELEQANIPFEEGTHTMDIILGATEIIKSPGIAPKLPVVQQIIAASIPIISEIEFAYRYKGDSRIVAITGSNGKTTTTNLTFYIFQQAGYSVSMCGNVGYSFARQIFMAPTQWYIIEVSSFQLDDIITFKPDVAVLLNITPDHLDRYNYNFSEYIASKFRIAMNLTNKDFFVINLDDPAITENMNLTNNNFKILPFTMSKELDSNQDGAHKSDKSLVININGELTTVATDKMILRGSHNHQNSMAAGITARVEEIRKESVKQSMESFKGMEHRIEIVATIRGIEFINDSKATNVNSVWYALETMDKPTVLIMGGKDKGNDYNVIVDLIATKVKAIVCLGEDNTNIIKAFEHLHIPIIETKSAKAAVEESFKLAVAGDAVMLSPACASFDLFSNYEDRGNQFKAAVKEL